VRRVREILEGRLVLRPTGKMHSGKPLYQATYVDLPEPPRPRATPPLNAPRNFRMREKPKWRSVVTPGARPRRNSRSVWSVRSVVLYLYPQTPSIPYIVNKRKAGTRGSWSVNRDSGPLTLLIRPTSLPGNWLTSGPVGKFHLRHQFVRAQTCPCGRK
jgi:hypothetical protein